MKLHKPENWIIQDCFTEKKVWTFCSVLEVDKNDFDDVDNDEDEDDDDDNQFQDMLRPRQS